MKKSKEFIIERPSNWVYLSYLNGCCVDSRSYHSFLRFFGIKLKPNEKKRIKITIEEIQK